MDFLMIIY